MLSVDKLNGLDISIWFTTSGEHGQIGLWVILTVQSSFSVSRVYSV